MNELIDHNHFRDRIVAKSKDSKQPKSDRALEDQASACIVLAKSDQ